MAETDELTKLLDEFKATCDAAPPGPWENDVNEITCPKEPGGYPCVTVIGQEDPSAYQAYGSFTALPGALEFVEAARTMAPRLVDVVSYLLNETDLKEFSHDDSGNVVGQEVIRRLKGETDGT